MSLPGGGVGKKKKVKLEEKSEEKVVRSVQEGPARPTKADHMRLSRNAVLAAERKVAEGVQKLYAKYAETAEHDEQGIAIIRITPDMQIDDDIRALFPNKLKNGITLHFFKKDSPLYPGIRYMGQEKIHSLCDAAKRFYGEPLGDEEKLKRNKESKVKIDSLSGSPALDQSSFQKVYENYKGDDEEKLKRNKELKAKIDSLSESLELAHNHEANEINKKYKDECAIADKWYQSHFLLVYENYKRERKGEKILIEEELLNEFKLHEKTELEKMEKKLASDKKKAMEKLHERTDSLMKMISTKALQGLYQIYSEAYDEYRKRHPSLSTPKKSFKEYNKELLDISSNFRSNTMGILTFNEASQSFTYDEGASLSSHYRTLGGDCANLSLVFDGNYDEKGEFNANTSYSKHASLVPIDDVGKWHITESSTIDYDVLMVTCLNARQVMDNHARLYRHGGGNAPITINWTYQLLTANFGNDEKQATSYGYMARALRLVDGLKLAGEPPVTVDATLINPGINFWSQFKSRFYKRNTRRRENRKAYMRLTDALFEFKFEDDALPKSMRGPFRALHDALCLNRNTGNTKTKNAYKEYDAIQLEIKKNTAKFSNLLDQYAELRKIYHYQKTKRYADLMQQVFICQQEADRLHDELRHQTYIIKDHRRDHWRKNTKKTGNVFSNNITSIKEAAFSTAPGSLHDLLSRGGEEGAKTERQLRELIALIYKSYADDLYYSGDYSDPTKAIYFNKYLYSYQHAIGLMASISCKSGNDRTKVLRDLIEAIDARPLARNPHKGPVPGKESPIIPEKLHNSDVIYGSARDNLKPTIHKGASAIAAVVDTGGGQSKVSSEKFPCLVSIPNVNFLEKLGKYAAHKMKKEVATYEPGYMGKVSFLRSKLHRAIPKHVDPVKLVDERVKKYNFEEKKKSR